MCNECVNKDDRVDPMVPNGCDGDHELQRSVVGALGRYAREFTFLREGVRMRVFAKWCRVTGLAAALMYAAPAGAQVWEATLNGASEAPPNGSPGTGFARMTLTGDLFRVAAAFSGLTGNTTAAHIHCCTAVAGSGTIGVATTTPTFPGFPSGVASGTYDATFDLTNPLFYNPTFLAANGGSAATARATLLAGMSTGHAYFNIHSVTFPGGEIRGFVVLTPEPSTLLLFASGLTALGGAVRRWRRDA